MDYTSTPSMRTLTYDVLDKEFLTLKDVCFVISSTIYNDNEFVKLKRTIAVMENMGLFPIGLCESWGTGRNNILREFTLFMHAQSQNGDHFKLFQDIFSSEK
jgi:hypothetical protein